MGVEQNKELVTNALLDLSRGKPENYLNVMADDFVHICPGTHRFSGTHTKDTLFPMFKELYDLLDDDGLQLSIQNVMGDGDYVTVQLTGVAKTREGVPYNNTYCHVYEVHDGKLTRVHEYMDTELITQVFGH